MKDAPQQTPDPVRALAERIADKLFTDGDGKVADRLVMVDEQNRMGGGWCRGAVVDRIIDIFAAPYVELQQRHRRRKK